MKKGLQPVSFLPFIALLLIIGAGVVFSTVSFYGKGYEYRTVEAQVLLNVVKECLNEQDPFSADFNYSDCNLNSNIQTNHLISITRDDGKQISIGVSDYVTQCALSAKNENYPRCVSERVVTRFGSYTILTGSNQRTRSLLA